MGPGVSGDPLEEAAAPARAVFKAESLTWLRGRDVGGGAGGAGASPVVCSDRHVVLGVGVQAWYMS